MAALIPFGKNQPSFMNPLFDDFYNMLDDFFADNRPMRKLVTMRDAFRMDVKDNGKDYSVICDLPGIRKDEIDIAVNDGNLKITVNRNEEKEDKKENYIHKERSCNCMVRSVYLGDVDQRAVKAKLEDGVLNITVPKKEKEDTSVKIDIE